MSLAGIQAQQRGSCSPALWFQLCWPGSGPHVACAIRKAGHGCQSAGLGLCLGQGQGMKG